MVKNMVEDKLLKQSLLYDGLIGEGMGNCVEKIIIAVLSARFGSVLAWMSERIYSLRE